MNSDFNMDFIMRIMNLKYSLDYDLDLFKNCILKFYIITSSEDELAESVMLIDATRIIDEAQILGANLLEDYEKYEEREDDDEYCGDDDLDEEEFDLFIEGLFDETWKEEDEKSIFFILQFESEEDIDKFIDMEFDNE